MRICTLSLDADQNGKKSGIIAPRLFLEAGKPRRAARVGAMSDCSTMS